MKRNVLTLILLGLVGFNAFACDIKVNGKWYEDMPCCVAKLAEYKRCDKLSLKDFNNANDIRVKIVKLYTKLSKCKGDEEKTSVKEEIDVLDNELKDISGLNYREVFNRLKF